MKILDSLFLKIITIIVILLFVVGFREAILTDESMEAAFGALIGTLPFAEPLVDAACTILKCPYQIPVITTGGVITDLLKLLIMACIQPIVLGLLYRIFLPLKGRTIEEKEAEMGSLGYRLKELFITILTVPLLAFLTSYLVAYASEYCIRNLGTVVSMLLGILSAAVACGISIVLLVASGTAVGVAILWRLVVTLGSKMILTIITNAFCVGVYVALLGGVSEQIRTMVIGLVVWLIIADLVVKLFQQAIVGSHK